MLFCAMPLIRIITSHALLQLFLLLLFIVEQISALGVGDDCVIQANGFAGVCRIYSDCPEQEVQAQNGIAPTICGFHQTTIPILCCDKSGQSTEQSAVEPNDNSFLNQPSLPPNQDNGFLYPEDGDVNRLDNRTTSERKCEEYNKVSVGMVQAIPLVSNTEAFSVDFVKCDYNGVALIVGGKPALAGEFPFMAAIGFFIDNDIEWRCGGTLISDEYILTAAHCTFSRDVDAPSIVRLGDLDLWQNDDDTVYADYNIAEIIVHPDYKYPEKYNDIALIRLSSTVAFTKFIRPACLYTKINVDQSEAIATGWGKTDYAATEANTRLMKVSLNVYDNRKCERIYTKTKVLPDGIRSDMVCAGELKGGRDTCQGDSGGPLIVTKKGNQCKFYVIGVTSFGKSCGQVNTPAVYTKVAAFLPWLESKIWFS